MSKRHAGTTVRSFFDMGYPQKALVNFIGRLGWDIQSDLNGKNEEKLYSLEEMSQVFDFSNLTSSPSRIDLKKLDSLSKIYLSSHFSDEGNIEDFKDRCVENIPYCGRSGLNPDNWLLFMQNASKRITTYKSLSDFAWVFEKSSNFQPNENHEEKKMDSSLQEWSIDPEKLEKFFKKDKQVSLEILKRFLKKLENAFEVSERVSIERLISEAKGNEKEKAFYGAIRFALTRSPDGFSLVDTLNLIGAQEAIHRIKKTIRLSQNP